MHIIFGIAFIFLIFGAALGAFIPTTIALIVLGIIAIIAVAFFVFDKGSKGSSGGIGMLYLFSFVLAAAIGMVAMSLVLHFV